MRKENISPPAMKNFCEMASDVKNFGSQLKELIEETRERYGGVKRLDITHGSMASHTAEAVYETLVEATDYVQQCFDYIGESGMESIGDNGIVRIQCEQRIQNERNPMTHWISDISKFSTACAPVSNTVIYSGFCDSRDYHAHLERISDFLLVGEGVGWHRDTDTGDFVFHDGDAELDYRP